jgi:hypothetical protein
MEEGSDAQNDYLIQAFCLKISAPTINPTASTNAAPSNAKSDGPLDAAGIACEAASCPQIVIGQMSATALKWQMSLHLLDVLSATSNCECLSFEFGNEGFIIRESRSKARS